MIKNDLSLPKVLDELKIFFGKGKGQGYSLYEKILNHYSIVEEMYNNKLLNESEGFVLLYPYIFSEDIVEKTVNKYDEFISDSSIDYDDLLFLVAEASCESDSFFKTIVEQRK